MSQNFLKSTKLAGFLIGHTKIRRRDLVVEIGAGSGVITAALARRAREVWAIEVDAAVCRKLRENLAKHKIENVRVIEGDFREVKLPEEPYKVFANPPFHLAAEVFYWLLGLENRDGTIVKTRKVNVPEGIWLILQKNMVLKMIPTDRHYTSQLGRMVMEKYDCKIRLPLRRTDFTPPPAVETVLYEAKLRKTPSLDDKM